MRVSRLLARFFFTDIPNREGLWSSKPCCRLDMNSMVSVHGVTTVNQEVLLNHFQLMCKLIGGVGPRSVRLISTG